MIETTDAGAIGAMWLTVAFLAAAVARMRGRSGLGWFLLTLFFGPFAGFFLAVLPSLPRRTDSTRMDG